MNTNIIMFYKYFFVLTLFIAISFTAEKALSDGVDIIQSNKTEMNLLDEKKSALIKETEDFVASISSNFLKIINSDALIEKEKEKELMKLFEEYVDTDWMGRFALGRYYRAVGVDDREKYLKLYHDYLICSYVRKFKDYAGETLDILRVLQKNGGTLLVQMKMLGDIGSPDIRVDYLLKRNDDGTFRIIDVIGEGISLITTQRSDFGSLISRKGIAYFVDKLSTKVASLKATKY